MGNVEGKIIAMVQRFEDNVVSVHVPEQGLKVLSNGSRIEVVAPQLLKSRTVGLCGDMNGEVSADLKTPGMCVMMPCLAAITYMLNKSGSESGFERCSGLSGLPSGLKQEFQRESTQCSRETIIPTPVSKLYERISILNKPTGMSHIVDKQSTKLCISKQMSRPVFPSHCPSSRSLLSSSASLSHLLWPALWKSELCLASPSSRRSPSSQLCSARLSSSQLPASLRCPPSPSNLLNGTNNTHQNSEIGILNSKLELPELELNHMII